MMAARARNGVRLAELLDGIASAGDNADRRVDAIAQNSRELTPGGLFIALSGSQRHGLEFAGQAATRGVVAILAETDADWPPARVAALSERLGVPIIRVEALSRHASRIAARFHGDPSADIPVVGITGTNGKTSCAQFLASACRGHGAVMGTLGYGLVDDLKATENTTCGAVDTQRQLAELRDRGATRVAMEVSSHALAQYRVEAVHFETAVFTNLSRDHLDYHGDMHTYGRAKQRLFQHPGLKRAVINLDDAFGRELAETLPAGVDLITYGQAAIAPPARATHSVALLRAPTPIGHGLGLELRLDEQPVSLQAPVFGAFNASNLMAVAGVLLGDGMSPETLVERLARLHAVDGRMQVLSGAEQPLVVLDYAHTPDALENALRALRPHGDGDLVCVFGCGGDRDRGKRALMGAVAERLADRVILTSDNPRGESPEAIVADILRGMAAPERVAREADRARAIRRAIAAASARDRVLIAGKGHEEYQLIGARALPFSDRAVARDALSRWRGGQG